MSMQHPKTPSRLGLGALVMTVILAAGAFGAPKAKANPEPLATYDGRVAGMAGLAVATVDSPAALYHNPARLDQIERFAMTVVVTSLLVNLRAPFAGPGTEQDSGLIYAPLGFVGGAARLHERIVVGGGVYVYTGFGGGFEGVPCVGYGNCGENSNHDGVDMPMPTQENVNLFVAEIAVPVQVTLIEDKLSLGVSFRLPWGRQSVASSQEVPFTGWGTADQNVSGFGTPGVLVGITGSPVPGLVLGAAYRSPVTVRMTGTTRVGMADVGTTTRWKVPHMVRAGAAYTFWNNRATVAIEGRIQFHESSNDQQVFELDNPIFPDTVANFKWKNVYMGGIGGELYVSPRVPLRIGATIANSASTEETMTPFTPPFGIQYSLFGGAGVRFGAIDLDFAFGWGGGPSATIEDQTTDEMPYQNDCSPIGQRIRNGQVVAPGGCAGTYGVDSWFLALSATYRVGRTERDLMERFQTAEAREP